MATETKVEITSFDRQHATDWKYAPAWLRACVKAVHMTPTQYCAINGGDDNDPKWKCWNSRRVVEFTEDDQNYANMYLL